MLVGQFPDQFAENIPRDPLFYFLLGGGLLAIIIGLVVLRRLLRRRRPVRRDPEAGLREDLAEYPPPPPATGEARLTFNGRPVRVRLVVVAPSGNLGPRLTPEDVPELLEQVLPGVGAVLRADRPRLRVWPPELSARGFAPRFYRLVRTPEEESEESRWVLSAGPVKAGRRIVLLGLAMLADRPAVAAQIDLGSDEHPNVLRVQTS
ncbi:MAG TPA: hypothetical protein VIL46_14470 [Gemmataceae bacterium]